MLFVFNEVRLIHRGLQQKLCRLRVKGRRFVLQAASLMAKEQAHACGLHASAFVKMRENLRLARICEKGLYNPM